MHTISVPKSGFSKKLKTSESGKQNMQVCGISLHNTLRSSFRLLWIIAQVIHHVFSPARIKWIWRGTGEVLNHSSRHRESLCMCHPHSAHRLEYNLQSVVRKVLCGLLKHLLTSSFCQHLCCLHLFFSYKYTICLGHPSPTPSLCCLHFYLTVNLRITEREGCRCSFWNLAYIYKCFLMGSYMFS